jgi:hypothetical protein
MGAGEILVKKMSSVPFPLSRREIFGYFRKTKIGNEVHGERNTFSAVRQKSVMEGREAESFLSQG